MRLDLLLGGDQLGLDVEGDAGEMAAFGIDGTLLKLGFDASRGLRDQRLE
ncbi:hypothetical protein HNP55_003175 [Paucibacter oligotrophus]|uniref:Uncharacterized protein n=1 Tax=Roseateles oligotrophus TaxID=1769250 RepID=A0A840LA56_9BURK|nr:hypothetical protein [Roseateles oligotrophus]MBB4844631.1 hypothetical protein [Roseateles oligotrophus]